jgi:hypothetical protein
MTPSCSSDERICHLPISAGLIQSRSVRATVRRQMNSDSIPLSDIPSRAQFIVLDSEKHIVAECASTPEAIQAVKQSAKKNPEEDTAIYRRNRYAWVKY